MYRTAEELVSSTKWGHLAWYGGGGYAADLGHDVETAHKMIDLLQSENWVGRANKARHS